MEKRTYIQPLNEVSELTFMQVLCVSEPVDNNPQSGMSADAPGRNVPGPAGVWM